MSRLSACLPALFLGCAALCGCASHPAATKTLADPAKIVDADANASQSGQDLDSSVRQAQLLRLAGKYDQAIHTLSQLMMVAADDVRVVEEYGKTLAAMGRAAEAVNFLTRARQLGGGDWTLYSALGVAYDEAANQKDAKVAYERALALQPGETSVLNNYALSRMLANDPAGAQRLVAQLKNSPAVKDPMILRNIVMIDQLASAQKLAALPQPVPHPDDGAAHVSAGLQPPSPGAIISNHAVTVRGLAKLADPLPNGDAKSPEASMMQSSPHLASRDSVAPGVVMQAVPADPLAGPVHVAAKPPHSHHPVPASGQKLLDKDMKPPPEERDAKLASANVAVKKPGARSSKRTQAGDSAKLVPANSVQDTVPALRMSASAY